MALTKRKVKGERRRRRWQNFRRRRRLLGFDDVPAVERPRLSTRPTPVVLSLREVDGWSVPRALRERVGGGRRELRCALSLSFFDAASRRFFGGTWMGAATEAAGSGSLLEAPNLKALEAQLIRVLTKAEAKGTTLERAFAYFDQDHGGTISVVELEDALRALGCFRGANSGGVVLLLKRFDENGDGVISLDEFKALAWKCAM